MIDIRELLVQIVNFLVLFFLLRAFAWKKILALLDQRQTQIASVRNEMEMRQREIELLKQDYEKKLNSIEDLARATIKDAVKQGEHLVDELTKKAHERAQDILNQAQVNIRVELSQAKEELKTVLVDLVIMSTERLLKEKVTDHRDRKLVEDFLSQVDKLT
jgi:F-type H+-transporting ATPase subunit b